MNAVVYRSFSILRFCCLSTVLAVAFSTQVFAVDCDACGPYVGPCQGVETYVNLDGTASTGYPPLSFSWSSDCPNADLIDPTSATPILILYDPGLGIAANCKVYLEVGECCYNGQCSCFDQCEAEVQITACQLDCEGTPNGTKVVDQCGVCGGDNTSCLDCEGTINGTKVLDRCGVCGGDGNSCLGCNNVDIMDEQFALDGNTFALRNLVRTTSRDIQKERRSTSKDKAFAKKSRKDADKLYNESWALAWSLPHIVTTCTNQVYCTSIDNSGVLQTFNSASASLNELLKKTVKRLQKIRKKRSARDTARMSSADGIHQRNLEVSASVPSVASACTPA